MNQQMETKPNHYQDSVVMALVFFSLLWSILGMAAGVYVAAELLWPEIDFGQAWLSFGRLRPHCCRRISVRNCLLA